MKTKLYELLRATKWSAYPIFAKARAAIPMSRLLRPATFILGCGRSGTTALGASLARHHSVCYLNEPLHYWYAIDRRCDNLDFFGEGLGQCYFDAGDVTPVAQKRFDRLFAQAEWLSGSRHIVEKLPANPLRVRWLDRLCPGAKFIHIIRDGRFVCRSIEELCRKNEYRIFGKNNLHQWWGRGFRKWHAFSRESLARGLSVEAFQTIREPAPWAYSAMAALEWLIKLRQTRLAAEELGLGPDRYVEVRYEDFVNEPGPILDQIQSMVQLPYDPKLTDRVRQVLEARRWRTPDVPLPAPLYHEFIHEQERLGYPTDGVRLLPTSMCSAS